MCVKYIIPNTNISRIIEMKWQKKKQIWLPNEEYFGYHQNVQYAYAQDTDMYKV